MKTLTLVMTLGMIISTVALAGDSIKQTSEQKALELKLKKIVAPALTFRNAKLQDVVKVLRMRAKDLDPERRGVNIQIKLPADAPAAPLLTLELRDVSLYDAVRLCCDTVGYQMRIDASAVVLKP